MLALLDESAKRFGEDARDRYATLIQQAMQDVADDPARPGTQTEPAVDPTARFYHIRHSRDRVGNPSSRVRTPRHVLVYEIATDGAAGTIDILGFIPDMIPFDIAMPRFIPER